MYCIYIYIIAENAYTNNKTRFYVSCAGSVVLLKITKQVDTITKRVTTKTSKTNKYETSIRIIYTTPINATMKMFCGATVFILAMIIQRLNVCGSTFPVVGFDNGKVLLVNIQYNAFQ